MKSIYLFFLAFLIINPVFAGTNQSGNATEREITLPWVELANLHVSVTAGQVQAIFTGDGRVNRTGYVAQARIKRSGSVISTFNLTGLPYSSSFAGMITYTDVTGDRIYSVEIQPKANSSLILYSWNFSISNDDGVGTFGIYVNSTFLPISTYSGDFPNLTSVTANTTANRANTTANNAVPTSKYNGDFPNNSVPGLQLNDSYFNGTVFPNSTNFKNDSLQTSIDTKEPAISSSTANKFWGWDKTFKDILISYVSGLQEVLDAMNTSSDVNNTASIARDNAINFSKANKSNIGEFTGGTILSSLYGTGIFAANVSDFNTTVNATMDRNLSNGTGIVPASALGNVNATMYNATVDVNKTINKTLSNYSNDLNWVNNQTMWNASTAVDVNATMDRNLSNGTGIVPASALGNVNATTNKSLSNYSNDLNWVSNLTMYNVTVTVNVNATMDRNLSNGTGTVPASALGNVNSTMYNASVLSFQNITTPTKDKNIIYQNKNSTAMIVMISGVIDATDLFVNISSTSPPLTPVMSALASDHDPVYDQQFIYTFIVLPNYYYRLNTTSSTTHVRAWTEWT